MIVPRMEMRDTVARLLSKFTNQPLGSSYLVEQAAD